MKKSFQLPYKVFTEKSKDFSLTKQQRLFFVYENKERVTSGWGPRSRGVRARLSFVGPVDAQSTAVEVLAVEVVDRLLRSALVLQDKGR
jgi:hypothetical protein